MRKLTLWISSFNHPLAGSPKTCRLQMVTVKRICSLFPIKHVSEIYFAGRLLSPSVQKRDFPFLVKGLTIFFCLHKILGEIDYD